MPASLPPPRSLVLRASSLLVVTADARKAGAICRPLSSHGVARACRAAKDALAARAPDGRWAAMFLAPDLADGDAFAAIDAFRARGEWVPTAVISSAFDGRTADRAFERDATLLATPLDRALVSLFLDRNAQDSAPSLVDAWQRRYGLTNAEARVL